MHPPDDIRDARRATVLESADLSHSASVPVFDRLADEVRQLLDVSCAFVILTSDERPVTRGYSGPADLRELLEDDPLDAAFHRQVVDAGESVVVEDAGEGTPLFGSCAVVPIMVEGLAVGGLWALHPTPRDWDDHDLRLLRLTAEAASAEIELRLARTRIHDEERRLGDLLEGVQAIVWECNAKTWEFNFISRGAERILGYPLARWYEDSELWANTIHPDDRERVVQACVAGIEACEDSVLEYRAVAADGSVVWLRDIIHVVPGADGSAEVLRGVMIDITDEKDRDRRLRRSERLASIGTLLGEVAHELNNPLTSIRTFAELLLSEAETPEEREALETVCREADRAAQVAASLRSLARDSQEGQDRSPEAVDLNDIVRHVLNLQRNSLTTRNIRVREDLAPSLPPVQGDRGELEQVVINLVLNAEQAMAGYEGGEQDPLLIIRTRPTAKGATLYIVDNGPGIPVEDLDRIFDPFYTTKPRDEGTGLGLSLVHSIVTDHEGEIRVESSEGWGAAFAVDLPRAVEARTAGPGSVASAGPPSRPIRILVVDDEEPIRRVLSRFLQRRGHRVHVASDGHEALEILDRAFGNEPHPEDDLAQPVFDVVLSDLRMPGLSGRELRLRIRDQYPVLASRIAFMTGESRGSVVLTGEDPDRSAEEGDERQAADAGRSDEISGVPTLSKPFSLEEVAAMVEGLALRHDDVTIGDSETH